MRVEEWSNAGGESCTTVVGLKKNAVSWAKNVDAGKMTGVEWGVVAGRDEGGRHYGR